MVEGLPPLPERYEANGAYESNVACSCVHNEHVDRESSEIPACIFILSMIVTDTHHLEQRDYIRGLYWMKRIFSERWDRILLERRNIIIGISIIPLGFLMAAAVMGPANLRHNSVFGTRSSISEPLPGLADRSPGLRTGDTLQKKPYNRPPVFERVLSGVREPVPFEAPLAFGPFDMVAPPSESLLSEVPDQFSSLGPSGPLGSGPSPFQPAGGGYPAIGGPAGGTPTAAVPELSTWAMMIIGFFGSGLVARRRIRDERRRRTGGRESHGGV